MKNLTEIINDPELYKELEKAYKLASPYRPKVLYRLQLINRPNVIIENRFIWNPHIPGAYLDAVSGYINTAIWCL